MRDHPLDYIAVEDRGHDTPCWVWQRGLSPQGYARVRLESGNPGYAHRVVFEQEVGPIPEGLQIDHLCRVRACLNPWHLEPVTKIENHRRGDGTKLTWEQVAEIRAIGGSTVEVGRHFGVHQSQISRIRSGKTWVVA